MTRPVNRRMPLSCEPCRERKIRCVRNGTGVCDACVRRGIPQDECIFLRDLRAHRVSLSGPTSRDESQASTNQELLERVRKLEHLLAQPSGPGRSHSSSSTADMAVETPTDASQSQPISFLSNHVTRKVSSEDRSRLARSQAGYERYEPLSSQWPSALRSTALPQTVDSDLDSFTYAQDCPFAPATSEKSQLEDLLSMLPPVSTCDILKSLYLRLFHILHEPTFSSDYARFRADPEKVSRSWLGLLFAVLSVSVIALDEDSDLLRDLGRNSCASKNVATLTARYRAAAIRCLEADNYLWQHNLYTLQALIILIYGINHTHGQSWALLGLTRNIAFALGCHVDPESFGLPLVESEQRRRCWAGLNMLYTIQNTTLGHLDPTPLPTNVKLPMDVDDEKLVDNAVISADMMAGPSQMSYIIHKFRLYSICSRICTLLFSNRGHISYEDIMELDGAVGTQQEVWKLQYRTDAQRGPVPEYHAVHLDILFGYSHQLLLLLHRPVLMQQKAKIPTIIFTTAQAFNSRTRCIESARALLVIHQAGFENFAFRPYRWYNRGLGSFHAFHAAVVIARVCSSPDLDYQESISLRRELEDSLRIFEALAASGMSRICERAVPILRYLCGALTSPSLQATVPVQKQTQAVPVPVGRSAPEAWSDAYASPTNAEHTNPQHLESFLKSLQPQPWLSPSMVNWDEWDSLLAEESFHGGYAQR